MTWILNEVELRVVMPLREFLELLQTNTGIWGFFSHRGIKQVDDNRKMTFSEATIPSVVSNFENTKIISVC